MQREVGPESCAEVMVKLSAELASPPLNAFAVFTRLATCLRIK